MNRYSSLLFSLVAFGMSGTLFTTPAMADDDTSAGKSLRDQPAVRHRLLLLNGRFELSPTFEATINADFRQTLSGGLKAEYHLSDMFSVGGVGFYGQSVNTTLTDRILATLPENPTPGDPTPSKAQFSQHLNSMPLHGAAYVSVTPWYGKLAAFGRAFVNFDFYFSGGLAFAQLTNNCDITVCSDPEPGIERRIDPETGEEFIVPDNNPNDDPPLNDGLAFGLYLGGGIHVFINNWIALDLTVRDYWFSDNPSGLDFNYDLAVTKDDKRFLHHIFMGVGLSIFFPTTPQRTR
jgi:outer membrane beta-barrel protein